VRCPSSTRSDQTHHVSDRTRSTYALNTDTQSFDSHPAQAALSCEQSTKERHSAGGCGQFQRHSRRSILSTLIFLALIERSAAFVSFPFSCFGISPDTATGFFFPRTPLLTYEKLSASSNRCPETRCMEPTMVGRSMCEEDVHTRNQFHSPMRDERTSAIPFTFFTDDGRAVKIMTASRLSMLEDEEDAMEQNPMLCLDGLARPLRVNSGEFAEFAQYVSPIMIITMRQNIPKTFTCDFSRAVSLETESIMYLRMFVLNFF
jgi:hypothetical protein